jgi:hypothetical protein
VAWCNAKEHKEQLAEEQPFVVDKDAQLQATTWVRDMYIFAVAYIVKRPIFVLRETAADEIIDVLREPNDGKIIGTLYVYGANMYDSTAKPGCCAVELAYDDAMAKFVNVACGVLLINHNTAHYNAVVAENEACVEVVYSD